MQQMEGLHRLMHQIDLHNLDLNLLVILDMLLSERSVTGAAKRLGRSQSAVSHALARLRAQMDDPLLVRVGSSMEPTAHAMSLAGPLSAALRELRFVANQRTRFDPATATDTLTILVSDFVQTLLVPLLYALIRDEAPGLDLRFKRIHPAWSQSLEQGEADLALTPYAGDGAQFRAETLFTEQFVALSPPEFVGPDGRVDLQTFAAHPHVLVAPVGDPGSPVSDAMEAAGHPRRIQLVTPFFLGSTRAAAAARAFIAMPSRLPALIDTVDLVTVPLPVEVPPFAVNQVWHQRQTGAKPLEWLRATLLEISTALPPGPVHVGPPPRATPP